MRIIDGTTTTKLMKAQLLLRDALEELLSILGLTIEQYEKIIKEQEKEKENEHQADGN